MFVFTIKWNKKKILYIVEYSYVYHSSGAFYSGTASLTGGGKSLGLGSAGSCSGSA